MAPPALLSSSAAVREERVTAHDDGIDAALGSGVVAKHSRVALLKRAYLCGCLFAAPLQSWHLPEPSQTLHSTERADLSPRFCVTRAPVPLHL